MSALKAPDGGFSSKRLVGIGYAALGIFIVVIKMFTDSEIGIEWFISSVSVSLASLGISGLEKFGNPKIVRPQGTTDPTKPGDGKS